MRALALWAAAGGGWRSPGAQTRSCDLVSFRTPCRLQELLNQKGPSREGVTRAALSSFVDDPELRRLHEERLEELRRSQAEARDREEAERKAPTWGDVEEVDEKGFLEATTSAPRVVAHFAHPEFVRCKVMKERLKELAHKHPRTHFVEILAPVRGGEGGRPRRTSLGNAAVRLSGAMQR